MNQHSRYAVAREIAILGAAGAAVLYLFIGMGILSVGESSAGATPDLPAFGLLTGGTFAVAAVALTLFESRRVWLPVALLQVIVLVGYVAASAVRNPPYEIWGLLIKAVQVAVLAAVAYLVIRGPEVRHAAVRSSRRYHR